MKRLKRSRKYTVLVVPKGTGSTRTFDLTWDYWRVMCMAIVLLGIIITSLGTRSYKQAQMLQRYEEQMSHKGEQLLALEEGNEVLETSIKELEKTLEAAWDELRTMSDQKDVARSVPVVASEQAPQVEELKGEGGRDESALSEYIPSFMPCDGEITSAFGNRTNPFTRQSAQMHKGIDIANSKGTPIYAAASGIVEVARYLNGYGYAIYIDHGNGIQTRYGHNSKLLVKEGDEVKKGDRIAKMGSTGNSTGSHLHFEILENGNQVNPENLFE